MTTDGLLRANSGRFAALPDELVLDVAKNLAVKHPKAAQPGVWDLVALAHSCRRFFKLLRELCLKSLDSTYDRSNLCAIGVEPSKLYDTRQLSASIFKDCVERVEIRTVEMHSVHFVTSMVFVCPTRSVTIEVKWHRGTKSFNKDEVATYFPGVEVVYCEDKTMINFLDMFKNVTK